MAEMIRFLVLGGAFGPPGIAVIKYAPRA
jgi:hypothetical protein